MKGPLVGLSCRCCVAQGTPFSCLYWVGIGGTGGEPIAEEYNDEDGVWQEEVLCRGLEGEAPWRYVAEIAGEFGPYRTISSKFTENRNGGDLRI